MLRLENFNLHVGKIKQKILLNDIDIEFQSGVISHILGDNGSGKSTLCKAILNFTKYSGKITYNEPISVIGSYTNVPTDLKVEDILEKIKTLSYDGYCSKMIETLDLVPLLKQRVSQLSDGQKQKLKFIVYLSSNPKTVILDEITSNLDKKSAKELYIFLNEYIDIHKDVSIINITHNLSDVNNMSGKYYYIDNKKIHHIETKEELFNTYVGG